MNDLSLLRWLSRIIGFFLMTIAFLIFPEESPWYYELLVFDLGLVLFCLPKFKNRLVQLYSQIT